MKNCFWVLGIFLVSVAAAQAVILPIGPGVIHKATIPYVSDKSFPELQGNDLEGKTRILPRDFAGEKNIVILAFKREQQKDVDTWIDALKPNLDADPKLALYELPVMQQFNFLMRFNINNGMRYGIADKSARKRTICLYLDKASLKAKLGLVSEDQIVVLIVDQQKKILAKLYGPAIPAMVNHATTLLK